MPRGAREGGVGAGISNFIKFQLISARDAPQRASETPGPPGIAVRIEPTRSRRLGPARAAAQRSPPPPSQPAPRRDAGRQGGPVRVAASVPGKPSICQAGGGGTAVRARTVPSESVQTTRTGPPAPAEGGRDGGERGPANQPLREPGPSLPSDGDSDGPVRVRGLATGREPWQPRGGFAQSESGDSDWDSD